MQFQIKNPISQGAWNSVLNATCDGSFFHTSTWAAVLAKAYHYRPVYITRCKRNRFAALLPVMEIDSVLTGKRGVSLPFTDACPSLADDEEQFRKLVHFAIRYAGKQGWRSLEFRTDKPAPFPIASSRQYYRHRLSLEESNSALAKKVRKSSLRNVRHALRAGVCVQISRTTQAVHDFYRLNCLTRKRHGLPPQPWYFFRAVHEEIINRGMGAVFVAYFRGCPIAGSIFFHYRDQAYYKYGASDYRYQQYRANNLVIWEALQYYSSLGLDTVDFGRTEIAHSGLRQFKRGWGAEEDCLYYYFYSTKQKKFIMEPQNEPPGYWVFKILPIPLLRLIGSILYPHVG